MIPARARTGTIYDLFSPPLILITPFISFMKHNDYSYHAPELWICIIGLLAIGLLCGAIIVLGGTWLRVLGTAGLLTLFVDLQFDWFDTSPHLWIPAFAIGTLLLCWLARAHLSRIIAPVFAIMLASTVALYALGDAAPAARASNRASVKSAMANGLPTIVHIILDEHIGIEGIPADVQRGRETKAQLKSFFQSYGFRLFGHAYSRYESTRTSLPNMFNYASRPLWHDWVDGNRSVGLKSNRYFADMSRAGYEIHAFQIRLVDLCRPSTRVVESCYTQDHSGLRFLDARQFSLDEKVMLIYKLYRRLSKITSLIHFNTRVRRLAEQNGWQWTRAQTEVAGMPPVGAAHTLSLLAEAVARSQPGQLFLAHLLLPHNPYVYDANCDERHPAAWDRAHDKEPLPPNTIQSRAHRYALYFEQVQCLYKKLGETFERWREAGVFDRAIIILHGDHGSRIYLNRPEAPNLQKMLVSDYADAYSTLLAVKAPGYEPGYDLRWIAIQDFLPRLITQGRSRQVGRGEPARLAPGSEPPYVFLNRDGPRRRLVKQPLPTFEDAGPIVNTAAPDRAS